MGLIEDRRFKEFGAVCVYFDRHGGVSPKPFDSLNTSTNSGDGSRNVLENLKIVKNRVGAEELGMVNQIHSSDIVIYDGKEKEADGIYTDKTRVFLGIKFADCMPIMLMDTKKRIIMAIHAGWRGTLKEISRKGAEILKGLGCNPSDIIVSIGPHICSNCYEVGDDVARLFEPEFYKPARNSGKYLLNLEAINITQLKLAGIRRENISSVGICTFEDANFFSYRRDGVCGRNIGGVMLL